MFVGCGVLLLLFSSIKGSRSLAVCGAQTTKELKLTLCYNIINGATILLMDQVCSQTLVHVMCECDITMLPVWCF